jgi:hypothetical protein
LDAADVDRGFEVILSDQLAPDFLPSPLPSDASLEDPSDSNNRSQYGLPLQAPSQDP